MHGLGSEPVRGPVRVRDQCHLGRGLEGDQDDDRSGCSGAALGGLDADGVCALAVWAPGNDDNMDNDAQEHGACWIPFVNTNGTVREFAELARAVRTLGAFDLDGVPDRMVCADEHDLMNHDGNHDGTVKRWTERSDRCGNLRNALSTALEFGLDRVVLGPPPRSGPGSPAPVSVRMPTSASWIGQSLFVQGYLIESRATHRVRAAPTDGLEPRLGP